MVSVVEAMRFFFEVRALPCKGVLHIHIERSAIQMFHAETVFMPRRDWPQEFQHHDVAGKGSFAEIRAHLIQRIARQRAFEGQIIVRFGVERNKKRNSSVYFSQLEFRADHDLRVGQRVIVRRTRHQPSGFGRKLRRQRGKCRPASRGRDFQIDGAIFPAVKKCKHGIAQQAHIAIANLGGGGCVENLALHSCDVNVVFDATYTFAAVADRPSGPDFVPTHFRGAANSGIRLDVDHERIVGSLRVTARNRARHDQRQRCVGGRGKLHRDMNDGGSSQIVLNAIGKNFFAGSATQQTERCKQDE